MSSRCLDGSARPRAGALRAAVLAAACAALYSAHAGAADTIAAAGALTVCAAPDNLPYSNRERAGFDNRIAALLARDLGLELRYVWVPDQRGLIRKTLQSGFCDVLPGVPAGIEGAPTTSPYYRSTYVFVSRAGSPPVRTFDDPRLANARVGVEVVGNDMAATPAGHALARRGIYHVSGFPPLGLTPAVQRMVDALARGELDVGVAWGPPAGYFADRAHAGLTVVPAERPADQPMLPFTFAIAFAVRPDAPLLRRALDAAIDRQHAAIARILDEYAVPQPTASDPLASCAPAPSC